MFNERIASVFVILGASSYASVGVVLSLAKNNGYPLEKIITSMYFFAFLSLFIISLFFKKSGNSLNKKQSFLYLASGLINLFITYSFYNAMNFLGVAMATLFIMQSTWIVPLISCLINKIKPKKNEVFSMVLILLGVFISVYSNNISMSLLGMLWGCSAALSYSFMLLVTSKIGKNKSPLEKGSLVSLGAFIGTVLLFSSNSSIDILSIASIWALVYAVFSTILPLTLLSIGLPKIPPSLAGMLIALEIPIAYFLAYIFLNEQISFYQIVGCIIIFLTIVFSKIYE